MPAHLRTHRKAKAQTSTGHAKDGTRGSGHVAHARASATETGAEKESSEHARLGCSTKRYTTMRERESGKRRKTKTKKKRSISGRRFRRCPSALPVARAVLARLHTGFHGPLCSTLRERGTEKRKAATQTKKLKELFFALSASSRSFTHTTHTTYTHTHTTDTRVLSHRPQPPASLALPLLWSAFATSASPPRRLDFAMWSPLRLVHLVFWPCIRQQAAPASPPASILQYGAVLSLARPCPLASLALPTCTL